MADALVADAARSHLADYREDLAKTQVAALHLQRLTADLAVRARTPSDELAASMREIRHDLRTPITAILGYGELVAEEATDQGDAWLASALSDIIALAKQLLESIDRLSGFVKRDHTAEKTAETDPATTAARDTVVGAPNGPADRDGASEIVGHVLVVDDNPSMRDLISRRLARHGHRVTTCDSGEAALDLTAEGGFDLVMLDLLMPGINGLEVLQRLKERPTSHAIPVIVMSALDDIGAAVQCIEAGADDYLAKPLDETLLRARIHSSLERKFLRDREQKTLLRLQSEQQRSDALLHNILPVSVVKRLRAGETVIADQFDNVTVLFCDLVGFTALSAQLEPTSTLQLLEEIFSGFDGLVDRNDLEKIKTIGDAYMVVGGISDPVADNARRVATMARDMPAIVKSSRHGDALDVRIGIHTGPAAGGIVGTKKFFYDVWGDTVNTASRLEASCQPGRIHVSEATHAAVGEDFRFEKRQPVDIQGKGRMQTFYLHYDQPARRRPSERAQG